MPNLAAHGFTTFETVSGRCAIAWSDIGVAGFLLPTSLAGDIRRWQGRRVPNARPAAPGPAISSVIEAAMRYFAGERIDFRDVAVDLGEQTEFFHKIYAALRQVDYGRTTTYGALAADLGEGAEMARDVGVAMATNPTPLIIPCHRVLGAGQKLGGFSAPGGSESKLKMLELEGVRLSRPEAKKPQPSAQRAFDF